MKKFLVVLLFGFLAIDVQAQWYSRSFGVDNINDLNETQLNYSLKRAESNIKTGRILTFVGIGSFALGTVIAVSSIDGIWTGDNNELNKWAAGSMLMLLGMGSTVVGVPFWISGASRRNKIEISLLRFNSSAITGYKQAEPVGLSLKINF